MITITLAEPEAFDAVSALNLESARALDESHRCLVAGFHQIAKIHAQRAEKMAKLAESLTRSLILQRGITEP